MQFKIFNLPCSYKNVLSATDKSSFRPDNEKVRSFKANPVGDGSTPVYDYDDGLVPKDDPVSPEIVAIRQGKLDRADVERLRQNILDSAKNENDYNHAKKVVEAIDRTLGISEDTVTSSSK